MNASARLTAVCAALVVAGCASTEGLPPQAKLTDPATLHASHSLAGAKFSPDAWPGADWWKSLGDAQLDQLIDEALASSATIRLARARVERANYLAQVAGAPRYPQVNAAANPTYERFSKHFIYPPPYAGNWYWQNQATLNFSYDFDFWGKNAAAYAAALAEIRRAVAANPDDPVGHLLLGVAQYWNGRVDDSIASYKEAIALKPDDSEGHMLLGISYAWKDDEAGADWLFSHLSKAAGVIMSMTPRGVAMVKPSFAVVACASTKTCMKARWLSGSSATAITPAMLVVPLACCWKTGFQKFSG